MKGDPPSNGMAGRRGEMSRRGESAVRLGRSISVPILCGLSLIFTGWGQAHAQSLHEVIDEERLRALQTSSTVGVWLNDEKIGWSSFSLKVDDGGTEPSLVAEERSVSRSENLGDQGTSDVWSQLQFRIHGSRNLLAAAKTRSWYSDRGDEEHDEWLFLNMTDGADVWHRGRRKQGPSLGGHSEVRTNFSGPRFELLLTESIVPGFRLWCACGPHVISGGRFSGLDFGSASVKRQEYYPGTADPLPGSVPWSGGAFYRFCQHVVSYYVADHLGWTYGTAVYNGQAIHEVRGEYPPTVSQLFGRDRLFAGRTRLLNQAPDPTGRDVLSIHVPSHWVDAIAEDEFQIRRRSNDPRTAIWLVHERTPRVESLNPFARHEWLAIREQDYLEWSGQFSLPGRSRGDRPGMDLLRRLMVLARHDSKSAYFRWQPTVRDLVKDGRISSEDCARVMVAAARYYELPARTVKGLAFSSKDRAFLPRTWCEIYVDGAWHSVDPYAQQMPPDATHLRLAPVSDEFLAKLKPLERPLIRFE